ncbi:MAG: PTS sugar transporter subunit IIA [Candidatus Delongbacteria bacterium]|nr:PTS sugar transporter subunit IIA [Candidatus Delongbacteria bacterium]
MDISDYISTEMIEIKSGHYTKDEVLEDIAELVVNKIGVETHTKHEILRKLREREELGSTGFGNYIAIPHCAMPSTEDFVIGFILYPDGADFDSMDEKPVKFVAFIIAPEKKKNQHIRFLSEVSGVLRQPGALDDISSKLNSVAIREKFLKYALPGSKDKKQKEEYSQLQIFCQNEQKFYEIINLLSEINERDISVIDGTDAKNYIGSKAFFGNIWKDKGAKFNKIIFAVVPTEFANDAVRKINNIIGTLPDRKGIMLIMQRIDFINGYLKD